MQPIFRSVQVLDLLLNRDNPRHVHKENQEDIIKYLLADEEVYNLARHMSRHSINPLEVVAVFPDEDGNLIVAEGNRRVCAAQLLTDPAKAPESARARFKALSSRARDVSQINIAEFPDYEAARPWLQVLHDGEQDGVGRRRWKPEQKARATTTKSTDALAVALLDYAERVGILDADGRQDIQVSTATRYLANPDVRRAMGVASLATSDDISITTDVDRFQKVLADFCDGIKTRKLHSRSVTADWHRYAAELDEQFGVPDGVRRPLEVTKTTEAPRTEKPARAPRTRLVTPETRFIMRASTIVEKLNQLGSFKLSNLYNSLTSLRLDEHPALLTAGAWVFLETLTALHGRGAGTDFVSYVSPRLVAWGLTRDEAKDCRLSLDYISHNGNAQKHSAVFTGIDARNLYNHFGVIERVLEILIGECVAKASK